jgi:nucleoside-diphosphate-sugar epimerase
LARVLIVGCGCRGRALAAALAADGHVVRGTTRDPARLAEIEAAGAEGAVADPDRLSTLLPCIDGISAVCWLMGTAPAPALHGPRLERMLEKIVDTPVRGLVYEGAGPVGADMLERGAALVRAAAGTYRMPVRVVEQDATDHATWLAAMRAAVAEVLSS